jgi:hypothetical protein
MKQMIKESDIDYGFHFKLGYERGFVISHPIQGKVAYEYDNGNSKKMIVEKLSTFMHLVNSKYCEVI